MTASTTTAAVTIDDFTFTPSVLHVTVGTKVTWTNKDDFTHTSTQTSGPAKWDSGVIKPNESFSFTFTQPGTYEYRCEIHTGMTGTIVVS